MGCDVLGFIGAASLIVVGVLLLVGAVAVGRATRFIFRNWRRPEYPGSPYMKWVEPCHDCKFRWVDFLDIKLRLQALERAAEPKPKGGKRGQGS